MDKSIKYCHTKVTTQTEKETASGEGSETFLATALSFRPTNTQTANSVGLVSLETNVAVEKKRPSVKVFHGNTIAWQLY